MSATDVRDRWTVEIFFAVALLGILLQMRGPLLQSFGDEFVLTESQLGLIPSVASLGYLPGSFAGAAFISRLPVERALFFAFGALVAGLSWIALAPSYPLLLCGMVLTGAGSGFLQGISRPLISHLYPARRGKMFNRQDMIWAVGATLGPGIATLAVFVGDWRFAYGALAVGFLPLLVLLRELDAPENLANETRLTTSDLRPLFGNTATFTLAAAVLLLSFVESGVFTWLPYYLDEFYTRSTANLVLSGFLAAYVPGRFVFGHAAEYLSNVLLVLGAALLALPLLLAAFVFATGPLQIVAIIGLGLLVAGMFPTLLAWGTNRMPTYSGPMSAIVLTTSGIGFMVYPAVMGVIADFADTATAMQTLIFAMTAMVLLMGAVSVTEPS